MAARIVVTLVALAVCACSSRAGAPAASSNEQAAAAPVRAPVQAPAPAPARAQAPAPAPAAGPTPMQPWTMADFSSLSARLDIELSDPAKPVGGGLMNLKAAPTARIKSLRLKPSVREHEELRDLTEEELDQVVLAEPELKLRGLGDRVVTHAAPTPRGFTVRDLIAAIEDTERKTRQSSEWLGGVDVHHRFFDGITRGTDGVWQISWGS